MRWECEREKSEVSRLHSEFSYIDRTLKWTLPDSLRHLDALGNFRTHVSHFALFWRVYIVLSEFWYVQISEKKWTIHSSTMMTKANNVSIGTRQGWIVVKSRAKVTSAWEPPNWYILEKRVCNPKENKYLLMEIDLPWVRSDLEKSLNYNTINLNYSIMRDRKQDMHLHTLE